MTGITLPGAPALVVGSNSHVAWGFTNTYADWSDLILLDVDPQDPTRYRTPDGWRNFDRYDEVIEVAGGPAEHLPVSWTIWARSRAGGTPPPSVVPDRPAGGRSGARVVTVGNCNRRLLT